MGIVDPLYGAVPEQGQFVIRDQSSQPNSISCYAGPDEMLRVAPDGFYVRGVKIPQDDKEALVVYNAFLQWMSYMALTRDY